MNYQDMNQHYQTYGTVEGHEPLSQYTAKTFGWMFLGLLITFLVSIFNYASGFVFEIFKTPYAALVLVILELGVVLILSSQLKKLSVGIARTLFLAYSVLNGIVFSTYFLMYQMETLLIVFAATALFFGIMALVGYYTKADLSSLRNFLLGALIFLLAFWIAAIFINLERFETMVCTVGIFVFLMFTAYDTQKIKAFHQFYAQDAVMAKKASIMAALQLYLDFINLFLYLLRIVGRRR